MKESNINETLADAVLDQPREFFIGSRRFCIWSPTLGMSLRLSRHLAALGVSSQLMARNPAMEALRLAATRKEEVCTVLALSSFRRKSDLDDSTRIRKRSGYFEKNLSEKETASLLLAVLSAPRAESLIEESGLAREHEEQARISRIKNKNGNTVMFGGRTIYGSLIAPACERFHLTPHQAVWETSLVNLRMLLADQISSIYLTEEETRQCGVRTDSVIDADNPENISKIRAMDWS